MGKATFIHFRAQAPGPIEEDKDSIGKNASETRKKGSTDARGKTLCYEHSEENPVGPGQKTGGKDCRPKRNRRKN